MFRAVCFDVFGTLIEIGDPVSPWREITAAGTRKAPDPMVRPLSAQDYAAASGAAWDPEWDAALNAQIASMQLIPGAEEALRSLHRFPVRIALASNLALPYVPAVRRLLGAFIDAEHFSCFEGTRKPEHAFYGGLCAKLGVRAHEAVMIGNSPTSDYRGAQASGLCAILVHGHTNRSLASAVAQVKRSL